MMSYLVNRWKVKIKVWDMRRCRHPSDRAKPVYMKVKWYDNEPTNSQMYTDLFEVATIPEFSADHFHAAATKKQVLHTNRKVINLPSN